MSTKYIYVVLSQTQTKFAKIIRLFGKVQYNHAAISLDGELNSIYAYARPQHNAVLLARLVKESLERYTLRGKAAVPVVVIRVPVTEEQYKWVEDTLGLMYNNPEYMYNLFSVLTYPITKGFAVENTFTCIEFVSYILQKLGYLTEKECYQYKPDDLLSPLEALIFYRGDIRGCMKNNPGDGSYFAPFTIALFVKSIKEFSRLLVRTCMQSAQGRAFQQIK